VQKPSIAKEYSLQPAQRSPPPIHDGSLPVSCRFGYAYSDELKFFMFSYHGQQRLDDEVRHPVVPISEDNDPTHGDIAIMIVLHCHELLVNGAWEAFRDVVTEDLFTNST